MTVLETLKELVYGQDDFLRKPGYRESVAQLQYQHIGEDDLAFLITLYWGTKDLFTRNQILSTLVLRCLDHDLEDFFLAAIKREKMIHDFRLTAIRGYAAYVDEDQIVPWMDKLTTSLAKIPHHTPAAYQTYEPLLSVFGLPYLVERYGYRCFVDALAQVQRQYDAMPDEVKGIYTIDAHGALVDLRHPG